MYQKKNLRYNDEKKDNILDKKYPLHNRYIMRKYINICSYFY